jgi:hypothetical protein
MVPCAESAGREHGVASPLLVGEGRNDSLQDSKVLPQPYCVFARCGGIAVVTKWVASSMAVPSGVGITMRYGTR